MADLKNDNISSIRLPSEDGILSCLSRHFPNSHPRFSLCRGDDCAIFTEERKLCISADLFLEDVHFRLAYFTPEDIGYKALAANISDLCACGAKPIGFTLCLGLPRWVDMAWLERFFAGMSQLSHKYNMVLAGGDLSRSQKLHVSISVFGESPDGCMFLNRGGSMPGDSIFVIGEIGLARVGFMVMEHQGRSAMNEWPKSCEAHLRPTLHVESGLMLARLATNARPPALMDVSDGILRDLPRLLGQSGELGSPSKSLGASIEISPNILDEELRRFAQQNDKDAVLEALTGGEDYALLGSCAPDIARTLHTAIPGFQVIGKVTGDGVISCNGNSLEGQKGFDHFENFTFSCL